MHNDVFHSKSGFESAGTFFKRAANKRSGQAARGRSSLLCLALSGLLVFFSVVVVVAVVVVVGAVVGAALTGPAPFVGYCRCTCQLSSGFLQIHAFPRIFWILGAGACCNFTKCIGQNHPITTLLASSGSPRSDGPPAPTRTLSSREPDRVSRVEKEGMSPLWAGLLNAFSLDFHLAPNLVDPCQEDCCCRCRPVTASFAVKQHCLSILHDLLGPCIP